MHNTKGEVALVENRIISVILCSIHNTRGFIKSLTRPGPHRMHGNYFKWTDTAYTLIIKTIHVAYMKYNGYCQRKTAGHYIVDYLSRLCGML